MANNRLFCLVAFSLAGSSVAFGADPVYAPQGTLDAFQPAQPTGTIDDALKKIMNADGTSQQTGQQQGGQEAADEITPLPGESEAAYRKRKLEAFHKKSKEEKDEEKDEKKSIFDSFQELLGGGTGGGGENADGTKAPAKSGTTTQQYTDPNTYYGGGDSEATREGYDYTQETPANYYTDSDYSNDIANGNTSEAAAMAQPSNAPRSLLDKLAAESWSEANETRGVANFCGGGSRGGNQSKCMCAQAATEALTDAGICKSRPAGNALNLYKLGIIKANCSEHLQESNITDPRKAPEGSVIVYSGYAGRRVHNYGHIEIKLKVTEAILRKLGTGWGVNVGDYIYCSDYCSAKPTWKKTNAVAMIYTLK